MMQKNVKNKISVGLLGATGMVGQHFVSLLHEHPFFSLEFLAASDKSAGKKYEEATNWHFSFDIPENIKEKKLVLCRPENISCSIVFSALEGDIAYEIEKEFVEAGFLVFSSTKSYRLQENVPLVIPEVNSDHLFLLKKQKKGKVISHSNCVAAGLSIALKPLEALFGLEAVHVVTLQAISGAGYPGVASLDILGNVIPFISDEEEKIEKEVKKILGLNSLRISAQVHRVPVQDGHLQAVSVKLKTKVTLKDLTQAWEKHVGLKNLSSLPTAPKKLIYLFEEKNFPQPKKHSLLEKGMAISIGRVQECQVLDFKFSTLSHNMFRGGAGGTLLTAEMMFEEKLFPSTFYQNFVSVSFLKSEELAAK